MVNRSEFLFGVKMIMVMIRALFSGLKEAYKKLRRQLNTLRRSGLNDSAVKRAFETMGDAEYGFEIISLAVLLAFLPGMVVFPMEMNTGIVVKYMLGFLQNTLTKKGTWTEYSK